MFVICIAGYKQYSYQGVFITQSCLNDRLEKQMQCVGLSLCPFVTEVKDIISDNRFAGLLNDQLHNTSGPWEDTETQERSIKSQSKNKVVLKM